MAVAVGHRAHAKAERRRTEARAARRDGDRLYCWACARFIGRVLGMGGAGIVHPCGCGAWVLLGEDHRSRLDKTLGEGLN